MRRWRRWVFRSFGPLWRAWTPKKDPMARLSQCAVEEFARILSGSRSRDADRKSGPGEAVWDAVLDVHERLAERSTTCRMPDRVSGRDRLSFMRFLGMAGTGCRCKTVWLVPRCAAQRAYGGGIVRVVRTVIWQAAGILRAWADLDAASAGAAQQTRVDEHCIKRAKCLRIGATSPPAMQEGS